MRDVRILSLVAQANIEAGEEIFISYGKPYWDAAVMFEESEDEVESGTDSTY